MMSCVSDMYTKTPILNPKPRFEALWARNCIRQREGAEVGSKIANTLLGFYAQSERFYHTFNHIEFCLGLFDQVKGQSTDADAIELAIWFHDAVYNFPLVENEKLSAEFFMKVSEGYLPLELRKKIYALVIVTDHKTLPINTDQEILVDIDLSSFGLPWQRFIDDGENVRRELSYLNEDDFYRQQIGFMKQLTAGKYFYKTPWFQDQFEASARANIGGYFDLLVQQGRET